MFASLAPRLARPTTVVNSSSAATRAVLAGRRSISTSAIARASPEASGTGGSANKEKGPLGVPISGSKSGDNTMTYGLVGLAGVAAVWYYFSSSQQAQKDGGSAGGRGVVGTGHPAGDVKQDMTGSRIADSNTEHAAVLARK